MKTTHPILPPSECRRSSKLPAFVFAILSSALLLSPSLRADILGIETFSYPNGPIDGRNGGTHFDWHQLNKSHTGTVSDWDAAFGAPSVAGGKLLTNGGGSVICDREYNGPTESVSFSYDNDEMSAGAIRANFPEDQNEVVYYKIEMTRSASTAWSGISSMDFGDETVFFGVPTTFAPSGNREFGIEVRISNPTSDEGRTFSGVVPVVGKTYILVAKIDYGNDLLSLWLDPSLDSPENANTPTVTRPYVGVKWSTGVRVTAGNEATYDNLVVATTWGELNATVDASANLVLKSKLLRKLKSLSKKAKKLKKSGKRSKAKKFKKKIKAIRKQLAAL